MGNPVPPPCRWPLARRLAAIPDTTECPRAALYIIPALPNVRDAATFQLVRATYIDTVKRLAPAGALRSLGCMGGAPQLLWCSAPTVSAP